MRRKNELGNRRSPDYARFQTAIYELEQAEDPTSLGDFKILEVLRYFSYRVADSLRLLYTVDRQAKLIIIHFLGDHKGAYGKD
jgi:mRNA-degrading endonuclease RelE of RelBE toxin-antitoxin system